MIILQEVVNLLFQDSIKISWQQMAAAVCCVVAFNAVVNLAVHCDPCHAGCSTAHISLMLVHFNHYSVRIINSSFIVPLSY
jgi:hypothetical protein